MTRVADLDQPITPRTLSNQHVLAAEQILGAERPALRFHAYAIQVHAALLHHSPSFALALEERRRPNARRLEHVVAS